MSIELTTPTREDLMAVYERLHSVYGPRNWWPADGPFEIIAGAILTQNTAWKNVEKALGNMRAVGLWSFQALMQTERDELAEVIRPSGYYNTKARKLQEFASVVVEEYDGSVEALLSLDMPELRERLLDIWGIGEETADDIVLYAAGKPSFVIDTYTRRIVDRIGWKTGGAKYVDYQRLFTDLLPADTTLFNEYHALLDAHGSRTCKKTPHCPGCPLQDLCLTGNGV